VLEQAGPLTVASGFEGVPGYRVKASTIGGVTGAGTKGAEDPLRKSLTRDAVARVKPFFKHQYVDVESTLKGPAGQEHKPA
jgi:hypothetical protein